MKSDLAKWKKVLLLFGLIWLVTAMVSFMWVYFRAAFNSPSYSVLVTVNSIGERPLELILFPILTWWGLVSSVYFSLGWLRKS